MVGWIVAITAKQEARECVGIIVRHVWFGQGRHPNNRVLLYFNTGATDTQQDNRPELEVDFSSDDQFAARQHFFHQ